MVRSLKADGVIGMKAMLVLQQSSLQVIALSLDSSKLKAPVIIHIRK